MTPEHQTRWTALLAARDEALETAVAAASGLAAANAASASAHRDLCVALVTDGGDVRGAAASFLAAYAACYAAAQHEQCTAETARAAGAALLEEAVAQVLSP